MSGEISGGGRVSAGIGGGGGVELSAPGPGLGNLSVPQVLPSGVSPVIQQQLIERTTDRILKVIVETADPGFVRIRQHYVDVNRRILREDNKFVDQFLNTGVSEFD